jgi:uncharacterized protein YecT (DUF1311 family)
VKLIALCLAAAMLPGAVRAQDIVYSDAQTQSCLDGLTEGAALSDCAGQSSTACINANTSGYTTVGRRRCIEGERAFWDGLLNETYSALMKQTKKLDGDLADMGSSVAASAPALRDMQRAWIIFRDTACEYELTTWGGGTGGGPAALECLMQLTADQVERLAERLDR